jgi:transcriptional regulator with XRE-family HTH domain
VRNSEDGKTKLCFDIGQRIRNIRSNKRLTLNALAERTGISKSYLSQVENAKREPSIDTLTKVAYALGVEAPFLMTGVESIVEQNTITTVRKDERKRLPDTFRHKGLKYESIAYKHKDRLMDGYIVELGFEFSKKPQPWHGEILTYVLEGAHELLYDGTIYRFNEGDSYYFDASKHYTARSVGPNPSKILLVFTFKGSSRDSKKQGAILDIRQQHMLHEAEICNRRSNQGR